MARGRKAAARLLRHCETKAPDDQEILLPIKASNTDEGEPVAPAACEHVKRAYFTLIVSIWAPETT